MKEIQIFWYPKSLVSLVSECRQKNISDIYKLEYAKKKKKNF